MSEILITLAIIAFIYLGFSTAQTATKKCKDQSAVAVQTTTGYTCVKEVSHE